MGGTLGMGVQLSLQMSHYCMWTPWWFRAWRGAGEELGSRRYCRIRVGPRSPRRSSEPKRWGRQRIDRDGRWADKGLMHAIHPIPYHPPGSPLLFSVPILCFFPILCAPQQRSSISWRRACHIYPDFQFLYLSFQFRFDLFLLM